MKKYSAIILLSFIVSVGFNACSTKRNTLTSRSFHNLTSYYNIYFNANESFNEGMLKIDNTFKDNYSEVLPVFTYGSAASAKLAVGEMDKTLEKTAKIVKYHSITAKPKRKSGGLFKKDKNFYNKQDYNNWIDDSHLLSGQANFVKNDLTKAAAAFDYVIAKFGSEKTADNAKIWLARVYIEQENFADAETWLKLLLTDKKRDPKLELEINLSLAHLYLQQKKYAEALPFLEFSAKNTKNKQKRARYKYILAQIYERTGKNDKATLLYAEVIKLNPPYDMAFNAQINSVLNVNRRQIADAEKRLRKMLRDEKNYDYRDRIYFALGRLFEQQNKPEDAFKYYLEAVSVPESDRNVKALSFLGIAEHYFVIPEYVKAQAYYDSTMQFLDTKHAKYKELKLKNDNLGGLVEQLQAIALNDSLLRLAALPESNRFAIIDAIIEKVKRAEEEAKNPANRQTQYMQDEFDRNKNQQGGASFYFYNQAMVSIGTAEFKKKWGNRRLEDDWRRKNKAVVEFTDDNDTDNTDESEGDKITDNKSREFYLQDIPLSDSLRLIVNTRIEKAYLKAAEIYKLNLQDYKASAKVYEEFIAKFPKNGFLSAVYYDLYLIYTEIKEPAKAEFYKTKLINEFPESNYAMLFTNPEYIKELARKEAEAERFYEKVYELFRSESYEKVISEVAIATTNFPNHKLLPKFNLLRVMSLGALHGPEVYATELQNFIKEVKQADLKKRAEEMLAVLVSANEIVSEKVVAKEIEIYDTNLNQPHLIGLIIYASEINVDELKFRLISFNLDFYTNENYQVEIQNFNENTKLFLVKTLPDKAKAQEYFTRMQSNPNIFKGLKPETYKLMYITVPNFGVLASDKNTEKYLQFFKKYY